VIARAILRSHEGALLAENLESGGARFTLVLPSTQSKEPAADGGIELGAETPERR
jgi:K+-sensing histidine kinase KdpD